jgi:hypothetical protein
MFDNVREAIKQADAEAAEYARWQEKRQLRLQSAEPAKQERNIVSQNETSLVVLRHEIAQSEQRMRAYIVQRLEAFAEMAGGALGQAEREIRDEHAAEIAGLRAEIETLRQQLNSDLVQSADEVVPSYEDVRPLRMVGGRDA